MSEETTYSKLSFSGKMLLPGFSIYLFEVICDNAERLYYIGMTGDNHYPSARSAIHRLSGHFERAKASTQNQIKIKLDSSKELQLDKLKVEMHHWSIDGFEPWGGALKSFKVDSLSTDDRNKYKAYKERQGRILALEKALIYFLRNVKKVEVINKTKGYKNEEILKEFGGIKDSITKIVNGENNE